MDEKARKRSEHNKKQLRDMTRHEMPDKKGGDDYSGCILLVVTSIICFFLVNAMVGFFPILWLLKNVFNIDL